MKKEQFIAQVQSAGKDEARLSLLFHNYLATKVKLHPTDMECLEIIIDARQITPGELSHITGLSTGAMTAALNRLERRNFIVRARSTTDRRNVFIQPVMEHAQATFALYLPFVSQANTLLESYSTEELRFIHNHYRAMAAIYEAQLKG